MNWTPGIMLQAEDRAHRIGQPSCVNVYYLFGENTVDDFIYPSLRFKSDVTSKILDDKRADFEMEKKSQNEGMEGVKEDAKKDKDLESNDSQNKNAPSQKKQRKRSRAEINREESYSARRITDFMQPKSQNFLEEEISTLSGSKDEDKNTKSQPRDWNEEEENVPEEEEKAVDKEQIERDNLMRSINEGQVDEDNEEENEREPGTPVSNIDEMDWNQELDRKDLDLDEEDGEVDYPLEGDFEVEPPLKGKFGVSVDDDLKDDFLDPEDGPMEKIEEDDEEEEEEPKPIEQIKDEKTTVFDQEDKNDQFDEAFQDDFMQFLMRKDIAKVSGLKTPPRSPSLSPPRFDAQLENNEPEENVPEINEPCNQSADAISTGEIDDDELDAAFESLALKLDQKPQNVNNENFKPQKSGKHQGIEDKTKETTLQVKETQISQTDNMRISDELQKPHGTEIGGFKLKINGALANNTKDKEILSHKNEEGDSSSRKKMRFSERFGDDEGGINSELRKKVKFE